MSDQVHYHVERISKKYIIDFLNAFFFAQAVLWDGDDQYNDLPIFNNRTEGTEQWEQRGALLVHRKNQTALRLLVTATKDTRQKVCYRLAGIKEPLQIDEHKKVYYPLDNVIVDMCIADLNLGVYEQSAYSFFDASEKTDHISTKKLFALVEFLLNCYYLSLDRKALFEDLILDQFSFPPSVIDEHYLPVFGVKKEIPDRL